MPLVRALLAEGPAVLSLVALMGREVVGHAALSLCGVEERPETVALLGPLAVAPDWQRNGVGRALINEGCARMQDAGAVRVLVLGDPDYYGPFGFVPDADIAPPYGLPEAWREAWQSIRLPDRLSSKSAEIRGTLVVPQPWHAKALWLP